MDYSDVSFGLGVDMGRLCKNWFTLWMRPSRTTHLGFKMQSGCGLWTMLIQLWIMIKCYVARSVYILVL